MRKLYTSNLLFKSVAVMLVLLSGGWQLSAQTITNYSFTSSTGTFTALTGATNPALTTGTADDGTFAALPIGFDFWYMGVRYTTVSASANGWMAFGSAITDDYNNSLSANGTRPLLAPLWDDLNITAATNLSYRTTGTAGSRIFTLQYLNVKWNYQAAGSVASFQVQLSESTGKISFVYRSETTAANAASASIGITAAATGTSRYLSVNNTGSSVSATVEASVTSKPASGRTYSFTPLIPTAPASLSFSGVTSNAITLQWADNAGNETGYVIYRSTDGVNYSFASQTAANATSSAQTGLAASTTYYWRVYAVTEGGLSTALSGTRATSCGAPNISQIPVSGLVADYTMDGNANDITGNNGGTLQGTPATAADRYGNAGKAFGFTGTQYISTANSYVNPSPFSVSIWFRTTTTVGGALIGFASVQTGTGGFRDRFIYMTSTGVLYFGVAPGAVKKYINTPTSYNDGNWHIVTGTVGAGGMKLYVDGAVVASDATVTSAEVTTGYWRVGHSDLATWPNEPSNYYFEGTLDDAIIYHKELSASEVGVLYNNPDGAGSNAPVCAGSSLNLTATTVSGATYSWTGPNSFTSSAQNPTLSYSAAAAGTYTVQVTTAGCAAVATAYTKVISTTTPGQWTGNVSSDWANANNWCDGIVPNSSVNVTIPATAATMPAVSSSVSCKDLVISSGASLTTTNTGTLNIAGTLANSGTMTNSGTTNFNGTSGQQTFSGVTTFYNLTVSNASGISLPATITVDNQLTLAAGTLTSNNFNISLKGNWINNTAANAFQAGTSTVTFNGSTAQSITGSFTTAFNNLTISNTGSTVSLLQNVSVGGNLSVTAGTFDLSTFTANRTVAGGNLSVANNATLKIGGTNTFPSNYNTNTLVVASTVEYSGTNQTVAGLVYGNLKLSSATGAAVKTFPATSLSVLGNLISDVAAGTSVSFTAASDITVSGNVTIGASTTFNGGSFTHSIGGNWTNNGTFTGSSSTLNFTGAGTSIAGAGAQNFNNLTIAAAAIIFSSPAITLTGNLATTGAGSFSQSASGTLTMNGSSKTISGAGISLNNLTVGGSVTTTASLVLTGNLAVSGSFTASSSTLMMTGTGKTISGAGTIGFSSLSAVGSVTASAGFSISSSLNVSGSLTASAGTATFTGTSSLNGLANLYNVTINGTSLQLTANSTLGIANQLTVTSGVLDVTSFTPNTVNFNGTGAQTINGITYNNLVFSNGGNKTAAAAITVNGNLTIGTGTTFTPGSFTHVCYANWLNNGTFTAGSGTIRFAGATTSNITGATTFNTLTIDKATSATAINLQSNVTASVVNMTTGTMYTGTSNTITLTNTRNGNGIILGNIQRTHGFTTGVSYAFESPNNTITLSDSNAVSAITVSVMVGAVSDFPQGASINREYNVSVTGSLLLSVANLRLHYEDDELNGTSESAMQLWRYSGSSWASSGKTANSTTANYVEQGLLSSISGRWTLSATTNVVRWNGSVSSDWATPANWTVVQGSAGAPPTINDIAEIGTVTFTNHPTISSNAVAKTIVFGSAKAANLTLTTGGALTVAGNVTGSWSANAAHTINANSQAVAINGSLLLSDGTAGHTIALNIGAGSVSVQGTLVQSGSAGIAFSGNGTLNIQDNFNYVDGVFTAGNGTVVYNGSLNQSVGPVAYNNLTINKAGGIARVGSPLTVAGNLSIALGELDNDAATSIAGHVSITSGAIFKNSDTLRVRGNWTNNGTYTASGGIIYFEGTGTQLLSATTFNNIVVNKPVGSLLQLTGDVSMQGNLRFISGTVDLQNYNFDRTVTGGSAIISDSATLILAGAAPTHFNIVLLAPSSTVIFNGTGSQTLTLPGVSLGNVIFRNSGTKTIARELTIAGNLTIESGSNLHAGPQTITLNGNWTNSGIFVPGAGTVLLNGISKTITGNTTFNKATISGSYTQAANVTYDSLLYITPTGMISSGSGIFTTMNGDLLNMGVLNTSGTTTFSGQRLQTLSLINATTFALYVYFNGSVPPVLNSTAAPQFGYLYINNTGGVNPSVGWTVAYELNIASGASFNGGISMHAILGNLTNNGTVTSNGILNFNPSSPATVNFGNSFSSTGTVNFGGSGALTLTGTPGSLYNVRIANTHASGITPSSGWNIANNFTILANAVFNAGSYTDSVGGNFMNNGTFNSGTSTIVLKGATNQDISSGSPFNNLTLRKTGANATLLTNITVNGNLSFLSGNISTGTNRVELSAAGTVTGASQNTGWVYGNLKKYIATGATIKTYETGDAGNYTPLTLTFSNVTAAGDLIASTTTGDHPNVSSSRLNPTKSVNRYWTLVNSGVAFNNYNVALAFRPADVDAGASTAAFGVGVYNNATWTLPIITSAGATSIQATGVTSLGALAVGEVCNANTTISYAASPYCTSSGTAPVVLTGTTGGTFSSSAGLAISPATGAVTLATSNAGAYDIVYNLAASGGCQAYVATTSLVVTEAPSATISYTDSLYCTNGGKAAVTFTGKTGGTYRATSGLPVDTATGEITLNASVAGSYTVTYTIAASGGCAVYATTAPISISTPGTWTGALSTDWNTSENWLCETVPTAITDVVLPAGLQHYPSVTTTGNPVNDLIIENGASLTIEDGSLLIGGSITNNGMFTATNGAVELNGTTAQTLPAAVFTSNTIRDLTVDNNAGVTLNGVLQISGILKAATGQFSTGGYLTLLSTAVQTALIDGSGNGTVSGNVTVQRYLPSGFGYRYVSSPFQSATVNEFADDMHLGSSFPSFFRYDENLVSSGWVTYTNPAGQLNALEGYIANIDSVPAARTIDMTGVVNNGTITANLHNHNRPYTAGFNLVGNPYPSPIDWDITAGWNRTNIDNAVYYFNAGTADRYSGVYSSYINGISSDGTAGNVIAAMQGFFVHVSNGSYPVTASLTINNNARVNNLAPVFHKGSGVTAPLLRLTAGFATGSTMADAVVLYFSEEATRAFDQEKDALKLMNTDPLVPSLYVTAPDAAKLSICAWPDPADNKEVVPLGLQLKQPGWIDFHVQDLERMPYNRYLYLYDAATTTRTTLQADTHYKVYLDAGTYENRFFLTFSETQSATGNGFINAYGKNGKVYVQMNDLPGGQCRAVVTNMLGQVIAQQQLDGNGLHELAVQGSTGIYIVSFYTPGQVFSQKILIGN